MTCRTTDKRALFVGLDAYAEAGGTILRDLFEQDHGGWLQDAGLLDMLVSEKLRDEATTVGAEGWKWIRHRPRLSEDRRACRLYARGPARLGGSRCLRLHL